jgi:diguanylate cyclase (GGDEF)-like protein
MTDPTPASERRYRILVVDDETETADLLRVECRGKPYDILEAKCGKDGLQSASADMPDLILLDYMMPDIDGISVARSLKDDQRTQHIPILLLTAYKGTDATVQAFEAGADDFVHKPFKWEEVEARISSMLRKRDAMLVMRAERDELATQKKQLEELMVLDEKTGLHNFGEFRRRLQAEWKRAERYNIPLSLILFDLDRFKEVNDKRGHQAGDQTLQEFAMLVTGGARANDVAARYGGEEFAIILPHTDGEMAARVAERIRMAVSEFVFLEESDPLHITVSGGVATYHSKSDLRSIDELVRAADQALYRAKERGRNCIVQHQLGDPIRKK